jgi:hypothetical protein
VVFPRKRSCQSCLPPHLPAQTSNRTKYSLTCLLMGKMQSWKSTFELLTCWTRTTLILRYIAINPAHAVWFLEVKKSEDINLRRRIGEGTDGPAPRAEVSCIETPLRHLYRSRIWMPEVLSESLTLRCSSMSPSEESLSMRIWYALSV